MKLFNLALIAPFNNAVNIRDIKKLSKRSVFIERDHLDCSHDRDYLVPGEGAKSIQSADFLNFDHFNKKDRYCRWALHTAKGRVDRLVLCHQICFNMTARHISFKCRFLCVQK